MQMVVGAEWNDENTRIVCELFAEQVKAGNRPHTHLNNTGYNEVAAKFKEKTDLEYSKKQFKNKWEKLKNDYNVWNKLRKQTGLGWDNQKKKFTADSARWKRLNEDIPGASKFRKGGLQNLDQLEIMFEDINNTGEDHWSCAAGTLPTDNNTPTVNLDGSEDGNEENEDSDQDEDTPNTRLGKRSRVADVDKVNKKKTGTTQVMQDQLSCLVDMSKRAQATLENFAKRDDHGVCSIQDVMSLFRDCGALCGSKEHFIASEMFVKREQREMFMTITTAEERLDWLRLKYEVKYGHK